jgi:hypothetical protein
VFIYDSSEFSAIIRIVSGVLQMGNLSFKQERQSEQATLPDNTGMSKTEHIQYESKCKIFSSLEF